jgi:hypothetical protein
METEKYNLEVRQPIQPEFIPRTIAEHSIQVPEFSVPASLLEAVSEINTRYENVDACRLLGRQIAALAKSMILLTKG